MRPVCFVHKDQADECDVNYNSSTKIWASPMIRHWLLEAGFKENEEVQVAYKLFTNERVFIGEDRVEDIKEASKAKA